MSLPRVSAGECALQARYGTDHQAMAFYRHQVLDELNEAMIDYIARQELCFIATTDVHFECDCSIRCGPPGFVRVLGKQRLLLPDYRGNGVLASLGNVMETGRVALLFVDFLASSIGLHVNGSAEILDGDEPLSWPDCPDMVREDCAAADGRRPQRWLQVVVQEAYIHCSKHVPLFQKLDKERHWGSDRAAHKGGDYFAVRQSKRGRRAGDPS